MIPAGFEHRRPETLEEATAFLAELPDARVLAGGHSLLPAMKLGLSQPNALVDLGRIGRASEYHRGAGPGGDRRDGHSLRDRVELNFFALVSPLVPETARHIGDVQVRNRGTLGGSLAHADPAADWPAATLALDAEFEVAGKRGRRPIAAKDSSPSVPDRAPPR